MLLPKVQLDGLSHLFLSRFKQIVQHTNWLSPVFLEGALLRISVGLPCLAQLELCMPPLFFLLLLLQFLLLLSLPSLGHRLQHGHDLMVHLVPDGGFVLALLGGEHLVRLRIVLITHR